MQAYPNAHGVNHSAGGREWVVLLSPDTRRMMSTHEVQAEVSAGMLARETLVWRAGMSEWMAIASIGELHVPLAHQHHAPPAPPGWDAPAAPQRRPAAPTQPRSLGHQHLHQSHHHHQHASAPNPQLLQEVVTSGAVAMIGVAVTLYMLSLGGAFAAGGVHGPSHSAPASSATAQKAH